MNGVHDLGGLHGFGPVDPGASTNRCFTTDWEKRVSSRFSRRPVRLPECSMSTSSATPSNAWTRPTICESSYYEHWLHAIETLARGKRHRSPPRNCVTPTPPPDASGQETPRSSWTMPYPRSSPTGASARAGHRRQTQVQGRRHGRREEHQSADPYPHARATCATNSGASIAITACSCFRTPPAHGKGEKPQHCYSVYFSAQEVWGSRRPRATTPLYVDLWDDYLVPA